MEVILDELQKNNVNIDVTILSQHVNYMLGIHEDMYNEMANRLNSDELLNVFNEMNDEDACTHFHFTYLEISFGQFHFVSSIIDVRH